MYNEDREEKGIEVESANTSMNYNALIGKMSAT